jgi:hypothetical protein
MLRSIPEIVHSTPFGSLAEAQLLHVQLLDRARTIEKAHENATAVDRDAAGEIDRLRRDIRSFEWRLAATGSRLADTSERVFAQSLLDFWGLRQAELSSLAGKLRGRALAPAAKSRSGRTLACGLLPYDEKTASDAAERAEKAFSGLPDDSAREAARLAFIGFVQHSEQPPVEAQAALGPFVEEGVLTVIPAQGGPPSYSVSHSALPQSWSRLHDWLEAARKEEADKELVKLSAQAWQQSGSSAELPRGEVIDRAARYSEEDESLAAYVQAARRQSRTERIAIGSVLTALLVVIAIAIFASVIAKKSSSEAAEANTVAAAAVNQSDLANSAVVSDEIARQQEVADVSQVGSIANDGADAERGVEGWIWAGTPDNPKVAQIKSSASVDVLKKDMQLQTLANLKLRSDMPHDGGINQAGAREAGVSSGAFAVALADSVGLQVRGTRQYWLKVRLLPVVYLQLDKNSQLDIKKLRAALTDEKFVVPGAQRLPNVARPGASPPFDVRYYYQQDEPAARGVADLVARSLRTDKPGSLTSLVESPLAERVKTGTIEVWLYQK